MQEREEIRKMIVAQEQDIATGEKLFHFSLPVGRVTSCTFGGENLEDLYITSAKVGLTEEALKSQPLAGALFVIPNCGFKGKAAFEFVQ